MGMIDVSKKKETERRAKAQAIVQLKEGLIERIKEGRIEKGGVLEQAKVAGILAAKKTPELIPLCHPLRITGIDISFSFIDGGIRVLAEVWGTERTGMEMEALVACAVSALTIYDMCKMYDKSIEITELLLLEKSGGKSGDFRRHIDDKR
ncbi:cyclic pyranopterin monophosphate synthase MoaC [bacterium]|nr:cyclic pyranopterin monophosphate synthase MoaC [bacterium]MBU1599400.1 cyclic pyranopterin monophosphate synthase MoaC [bacterium]MBU2461809.1 cyclic pyranopterin monophosphate synthase MoaC [bacterium]